MYLATCRVMVATPAAVREASPMHRSTTDDLDVAVTLAAGPLAWSDRSETITEWMAAGVVVLGTGIITVDAILSFFVNPYAPLRRWSMVVAALLAAAVLMYPAIVGFARSENSDSLRLGVPLAVLLRISAAVCVVGLWAAHHRGGALVTAWPFAVAAGGDIYLTMQRVGMHMTYRELWTHTFGSEIQLGALVGLVAVTGIGLIDPMEALQLSLAWLVFLGLGLFSLGALRRMRSAELAAMERIESKVMRHERRQRAHWLHDDISSIVGVAKMRLASRDGSYDPLRALEDLDHELRLRQLDELIESGPIQLAEVIQPYVRYAQSLGVQVGGLPGHETAGVLLDRSSAERAKRVIAGAMSNALKAGARSVEVRAVRDDESVTIEVEDDAGGFDVEDLPIGRGLDRLRSDLGESFAIERTPAGSIVRVRLPLPGPV